MSSTPSQVLVRQPCETYSDDLKRWKVALTVTFSPEMQCKSEKPQELEITPKNGIRLVTCLCSLMLRCLLFQKAPRKPTYPTPIT